MENNQQQPSTSLIAAENTESSNTATTFEAGMDFAKGFGGEGSDEALGVDVDKEGNVYIAGSFKDTAKFGNETLEAEGSRDDAFIAKVNNAGTVVWAQRLGGKDSDVAYGITVDESGNSYVAGSFQDEVTFRTATPTEDDSELDVAKVSDDDPTSNDTDSPPVTNTEEITFDSNGGDDAFIAQMDKDGKVQWAIQFGGEGDEYADGITVDSQGNTYITGSFEEEVTFGEANSLTADGSSDGFVTKVNASGEVVWANQFGGNDTDEGYEVAVDEDGNSYVMGMTGFSSANAGEIYIAKIDETGEFEWKETFDGAASNKGSGIAVDKDGNTYFTGYFEDTATFGNTTLTSTGGSNDGFVTKLDADGDVLWAKKFGGLSDDKGYGIALDESEDIYLTGSFEDQLIFGENIQLDNSGDEDAFIIKLDTMGKVKWAKNLGSESADVGYDIAVKGDNVTYVAGSFEGNATIDDKSISHEGSSDAFVVKLVEELPEISLSVTPDTIAENEENKLTYTFTSNVASSESNPLRVNFEVGGDAVFNQDYTAQSDNEGFSFTDTEGTITFEDGETTASITINAIDDTDVEQNETISLTLVAAKEQEEDTETPEDAETPEDIEEDEPDPELVGELTESMVSDYTIATKEAVMATITSDESTGGGTDDGGTDNGGTDNGGTDNGGTDNGGTDNSGTDNGSTDNSGTDNGGSDNSGGTGSSGVVNTGVATELSNTNKTFSLNGNSAKLNFLLKTSQAGSVNEIALFEVDDEQGTIGGVNPDSSDYARIASNRAISVFSVLNDPPQGFSNNLNRIIELDNGQFFRLLMVEDGTLDGLSNGSVNVSQVRLSESLTVSDVSENSFDLGFSGNITVEMQLNNQATQPVGSFSSNLQNQQGELLDLTSVTTNQTATFTLHREASFDSIIGWYEIADTNGGIDTDNDGVADVAVGDANYKTAAMQNRVAMDDLQVSDGGTRTFTGEFEAGSLFAAFMIVDGTPGELLDSDSGNDPRTYFSYIGANSDGADHVRMLGNNVFGFEDLAEGGDKDFNDGIVSVKFN